MGVFFLGVCSCCARLGLICLEDVGNRGNRSGEVEG